MLKSISINLIETEPWPANGLKLPRFQAHRGFWRKDQQENTIAAFSAAGKRGALMCECDIRLSKDLVPVVFHDENLKRLAGSAAEVKELTALQLKEKANVPTLEEILMHPSLPRFWNLELKTTDIFENELEVRVTKVIETLQVQNRILFSSFNPFSIYRLSQFMPDVPRALLVSEENDDKNKIWLKEMWTAPFLDIHALHLHETMLTPELLQKFKKRKIGFSAWTVNDPRRAEELLASGAHSIISDEIF